MEFLSFKYKTNKNTNEVKKKARVDHISIKLIDQLEKMIDVLSALPLQWQ